MTNKISAEIARDTAKSLALEIGNRVIHGSTGLRGVVVGKANLAGLDVLTVRFDRGTMATQVARQEFRLCSGGIQ